MKAIFDWIIPLNKWFQLLIPVGFIWFCAVFKDAFFEACKSYFVTRLSSFMTLAFAAICFIFGLHSSIFSFYDKLNNQTNNAAYDWFNTMDIIRFPFNQLQNFDNISDNEINFNTLCCNKQPNHYYFLLDKSGSIAYANKYSAVLKNSLIPSIKAYEQAPINDNTKYQDFDLEDCLLICMIQSLYRNSDTAQVIVDFYSGDSTFQGLSINTKATPYDQFLSNYTVQKIAINSKSSQTNFCKIVDRMKEQKILRPKVDYIVTLISDFDHEAENSQKSFDDLKYDISKLNEKKLYQLNLCTIRGGVENEIERTLHQFRRLSDKTNYFEINESFISQNENPYQYISYVVLPIIEDTSVSLSFYYPSKENGYSSTTARLTFKGAETQLQTFVGLKTQESYTGEEKEYLRVDKTTVVPINNPQLIKVGNPINVEFPYCDKNNCDYYADFFSANTNQRIKIPIIFKEILPPTSSITLIFLYCVFYTFLFSILIYLASKSISNGSVNNEFFKLMSIIFKASFYVVAAIYAAFYIYNTYIILSNSLKNISAFIISFIVYIIIVIAIYHIHQHKPNPSK